MIKSKPNLNLLEGYNPQVVSQNLVELRGRRTQEEIAHIIGIDKSTISNHETGKTKPDIIQLIIYSKIYNVGVDYLLGNQTTGTIQISNYSKQQQDAVYKLLALNREQFAVVYGFLLHAYKTQTQSI